MIPAIPHDYGNAWMFYVIVPVISFGIVAGLWLIVSGAVGLLGQTRGDGHDRQYAVPQLVPTRGTQ
jgi:hypothetical protein